MELLRINIILLKKLRILCEILNHLLLIISCSCLRKALSLFLLMIPQTSLFHVECFSDAYEAMFHPAYQEYRLR